jgi:hypothetical protein
MKAPDAANQELQFHPLADMFPLMEGAEFDALVADIKANKVRDNILLYEGMILDGRNRYRALRTLGLSPKVIRDSHCVTRSCIDEHHGGPVAYVISANIHRRHLTAEQRRDLIAKLIKAQPEKSDRQIAKAAKADHKTVGAARAELEARGEIPHVEERTDTRGRKQPAKKKAKQDGGGEVEVASPAKIKSNIFDTIAHVEAMAKAYKKVLAVSTLDQASKDEVSAAIGALIKAWQSLQRAERPWPSLPPLVSALL